VRCRDTAASHQSYVDYATQIAQFERVLKSEFTFAFMHEQTDGARCTYSHWVWPLVNVLKRNNDHN